MPVLYDFAEVLPILWRLNDGLKITVENKVEFTGDIQDIEDFRTMLHKLDPELLYEFPEM